MNIEQSLQNWITDHDQEIVEFLLKFSRIKSPRGHESEAADFLFQWLRDQGLPARNQPVAGERANVISRTMARTPGNGHSLLFNGHLDTAFGNWEEDRWTVGEMPRAHADAWAEGEFLIGDGIVNDKGPITAFLWAYKAIDALDIELKNDLLVTTSVGEIGGTTVSQWEEDWYIGGGIGTRRLVEAGVGADFALVAECTNYGIAQVEPGVAWFEVELFAESAYQPYVALSPSDDIQRDHPGAIPKLARAVFAIEEWATRYADDHTIEYDHATVQLTAGVGAVKSGNPFDPDKSPGYGTIYVDVRLPPGEGPEAAKRQLRHCLSEEGLDAEITPYFFRRGYVAEGIEPLTEGIEDAHRAVLEGSPPDPPTETTSMWRDSNIFNEVGIGSVNFGPPRVQPDDAPGVGKPIALRRDDLITTAKLYALIAISICGTKQS